jgi:hypothetical protein
MSNPTTSDSEAEELIKNLEQKIRDLFKFEATRNELNFALSGVERGDMTLQDYEDDLSVAISNWFVKDLLPARLAQAEIKGAIKELQDLPEHLSDGRTINPLAPDHDNYIVKVFVVERRITELQAQLKAAEGEK